MFSQVSDVAHGPLVFIWHPCLQCPETSEASAYTYNEYDTNTDEDGHGQGVLIDLSTPEPVRRNLHLPIPNG